MPLLNQNTGNKCFRKNHLCYQKCKHFPSGAGTRRTKSKTAASFLICNSGLSLYYIIVCYRMQAVIRYFSKSIRLPCANREIGVCRIFAVIANQCAHWCGNPPVERSQETITTKNRGDTHSFGHFSVHSPSNRGIATPVCGLVRNDRKLEGKAAKHQFRIFLSSSHLEESLCCFLESSSLPRFWPRCCSA